MKERENKNFKKLKKNKKAIFKTKQIFIVTTYFKKC